MLFISATSAYLISNFFSNPIINGSPTPWINVSYFNFFLFFIITFLVLKNLVNENDNPLITFLYFFLIVSVIAIKYIFSYGYDTLLHQASLKYIMEYSRIYPLTPFYIGQYVLEVLINFFTGWSFIIIERWLLSILYLICITWVSNYLLNKLKLAKSYAIVPIVALLLMPNQFLYSSPYAFSLLWGIISSVFIYVFLINGDRVDYFYAGLSAITSTFIHPFVGLSVLTSVAFAWFYEKDKARSKKFVILLSSFLVGSLIVSITFGLYNWLRGSVLVLADPVFYANKFTALFNDPVWYSKTIYSIGLALIYLYEKIHFFIITMIVLLVAIVDKKRRKANIFLLTISASSFVSAWIFISSLEVSGYSYGDQVNYSYRLLQSGKWLLWPIIIFTFIKFFEFIRNRGKILKRVIMIFLSVILTVSWYLTYPRNDDISRININNIREVDYEAIDFVYQKENGKDGYLVFANQLFGAGAIQQYGFEPYYETKWGKVFYYSVPMGGEFNKRYEKIMSSHKFDKELLYEVMRDARVNRLYFLAVDYWPLESAVKKEMRKEAVDFWNIKDYQIDVYLFELEK